MHFTTASSILLLLLSSSWCRAGYINLKAIHPGSDIDGQGIRINAQTGVLNIQGSGSYFTGNLTDDKVLHVAALSAWANATIQPDALTGVLGAVNTTSSSSSAAAAVFDISGGDLVLNYNSTFLACPLSSNTYNVTASTNSTTQCSGAIEIALEVGTYDGQSPTDTLPLSTTTSSVSTSTTPTPSSGDSENFILLAVHSGSDVSNKALSYDNTTGKLYVNQGSEFIGRISNGTLRDINSNNEITVLSDGSLGTPETAAQNGSSSSIFSILDGHLRLNGSPNFVACNNVNSTSSSSSTGTTGTSSSQDALRTSSSLTGSTNVYGIYNGTVTCSGGISLILQVIDSITNSNSSASLGGSSSSISGQSTSLPNTRGPSSSSSAISGPSSSSPSSPSSSSSSTATASSSKSSSSNSASNPFSTTSSSSIYGLIGFIAVALFTL